MRLVYDDSIQMRIVAGATVTVVVVLVSVIVATVWFLRFKHQDEVDKKSSNHLELPLEYASNEGKLIVFDLYLRIVLNIFILFMLSLSIVHSLSIVLLIVASKCLSFIDLYRKDMS